MLPKPENVSLRLLVDEGVPDAVGRAFEARGHHVTYANRSLARGSADQLVCMAALNDGAILVAADHDMKALARAMGANNQRFRTMSLIKLSCRKPEAAEKVKAAMSLIEHEWLCGTHRTGRRLWIEIQPAVIRIVRDNDTSVGKG